MNDDNVSKMEQNQKKELIPPESLLSVQNIEKLLKTLTTKQKLILSQLQEENSKTAAEGYSKEIDKLMAIIEKEKNKLENIKKKMNSLHKRSTTLRDEAVKIQLYQEQILEKEEENRRKEMAMIGRSNNTSQ